MRLWDFLAFLAPQGEPPMADANLELDGAHCTAAPPWCTTRQAILNECAIFRDTVNSQKRRLGHVQRVEDLSRPETKIVLGLQHPPEDGGCQELKRTGIHITTIAYQGVNRFGGGFAAPKAPLTDAGKRFLDELACAGMILDLAHAGVRTATDALNHIEKAGLAMPVVISHTGSAAIYDHPRNLPDEILVRVARRGGVVGVYSLTFGLHPNDNSLEPFLAHLEHAVALCGEDAIAIGSDGVYVQQDRAAMAAKFRWMKRKLDPDGLFRARFPDQPEILNSPARMRTVARYLRHAFDEATIVKLVGENLFRFFSSSL